MKKKKENNKKILISIIVILILITISILAIILIKNTKKDDKTAIMGIYDKNQEEVPSLKYSNLSEISVVVDESSSDVEIAKKFRTIFENNIPELKSDIQDLSDEEIEGYYEQNQKEIKSELYYIEKESFKSLCNHLKEMKTNLNQDFDICEFRAIDNKLEVTCKYKNGERITFILSEASKIEFKK